MLVKSLLGESTSIRVRPRADADLVRWGVRFIRECTPSRSHTNTLAKLRLARYSQQLTYELANREGLQYWQTHNGVLYLFHAETDLRTAEHNSRLLREHGRHREVLDYEQTVTLEPALGHGQR
jgi:D-amino-acid dehydrogenase